MALYPQGRLALLTGRAVAFHAPREVEVEVDGEPVDRLDVATDWRPFRLALPGSGKRAVRLSTPDPARLGSGDQRRLVRLPRREAWRCALSHSALLTSRKPACW